MYGLIQTFVIKDCTVMQFDGALVRAYLYCLVDQIDMKVAPLEEPCQIWEDHEDEEDFKKGVSANIFIETSNISVHACDPQKTIRVSVFTCKSHNQDQAIKFSENFWGGKCVQYSTISVD